MCCPGYFLPEEASFIVVENLMKAKAIFLCHCFKVMYVFSSSPFASTGGFAMPSMVPTSGLAVKL